MQIQIENAEGVQGLLEDLNPAYIDSNAIVGMVHDGIRRIQGGQPGTYEDLYRTYQRHLRFIVSNAGPCKSAAAKLLRRLYLLQTLPFGELENPDFVDGYTGEHLERLDHIIPDQRQISLMEAIDEMEVHDCHVALKEISDWNAWLASRAPYEDAETNQAFMQANLGWPGLEVEVLPLDDRGYQPEHITALTEGQPDQDFRELLVSCSQETQALRNEIADAISRYGNADRQAPERIRRQVVTSMAGIGFLQRLQYEINGGASPANVASLFLRFQHAYCFAGQRARRRGIHDDPPFGPNVHASTVLLPDNSTLEEFIDTFESELLDGVEAMGPASRDNMTEAEIRTECDYLFKQYINAIEEYPVNPRHSRYWVEGFIMSVNAGAPLRRTSDGRTASDGAWDHWRMRLCPEGAKSYARALKNGATRTQAMRCFYLMAEKAGLKRPARPKRIKAVRKHGLVLTNGKFVTWHIAGRIHNEEGFDLDVENKARLKEMLTSRNWGVAFAEVL